MQTYEISISADLERGWDYSNLGTTEARFLAALEKLKAAEKPDCSLIIETLTQVARAQALQDRFLQAEASLAEAEGLLEKHVSNYHVRARIRFLLEKGRISVMQKTPAKAFPLFSEAWALASQANEDFHSIDAAQMIASVESPKFKKDWTLKALGLAESASDPRAKLYLSGLYSTLGWHAYELHQFERAQDLFNKALVRLQGEAGLEPDATLIKRIRVIKWALGKVLRTLGRVEEALKVQEELFAEHQRSGSKNGDVCEELAECLTLLKRANEAALYFEIAYRELSCDEWVVDNMPERMKRLKSLGKVKTTPTRRAHEY